MAIIMKEIITATPVTMNHTEETMSLLHTCWCTEAGRVNIR